MMSRNEILEELRILIKYNYCNCLNDCSDCPSKECYAKVDVKKVLQFLESEKR